MSSTASLAAELALPFFALVAGIVAHEGMHYLACRLAGAPARPTYKWGVLAPNPAIETDPLAHTTLSYRATCLAPLALLLPSIAVGVALGLVEFPFERLAPAMWFAWCLALVPSWPDVRNTVRAGVIADMHDVREAPHTVHAAAEGYDRLAAPPVLLLVGAVLVVTLAVVLLTAAADVILAL